ncbi:MAG TPA: AMP-binding protein [Streptosporangiaceae bacterium]
MSKVDDLIAEVSVTRRLVCVASERPGVTALIGGPGPDGQPGGGSYSFPGLAATVQAAAAGLTWRGLQPRDVVGVFVPDAVGFAVAVHAIRAAGGVPSPVDPGLCAVETAGQLAESGARMIITSPPLADTALAAVDRSWVRQVFSFVDAAGATRFGDLLGLDMIRPSRGRPDDVALLPFSRGAGGRLRPSPVTHREMADRVGLADADAGFTSRDVVMAMPPSGDGLGYAVLIDSALLRGATVVAVTAPELVLGANLHHGTVALVPEGAGIDVPARVRAISV